MRLTRRFVLAAVPAAFGGWVLARLGLGGNPDIGAVLRLLGDPMKARAIGMACLDSLGRPSAREVELALRSETDLRARVRSDFAAGRIMLVRGWVLSATEARLYALAALKS